MEGNLRRELKRRGGQYAVVAMCVVAGRARQAY
ncbi:MAG: hypothetical protein OSB45_15620 [Pseudomonadales bacterium]|nr:hypothetical protein [Pseudomonadales bacterium]